MQSALFVAERFLGDQPDFSAYMRLANPNFLELKAELQERWANNRDAALRSRFEKLDGERWLSRKQIDELMRLLDELIANEPTPERLVAKLRLPREKEAQQLFKDIFAELETISKEGNHSKRRDSILGELRLLQDLAIDLAAGDHREYARHVTAFVLKTEAYLLQADNERLKHEISVSASREIETDFELFKNALLETDPLRVLSSVGSILIETQGTDLFQQASDLSLHWLEQSGKLSYRRIFAQHPEEARQILRQTRELIARNQSVLPKQFQDQLQGLLKDLASQFEPPVKADPGPAPGPAPPPAFSPPPTRQSRWQEFKRWLNTKLNRGGSS
jgi:hypothetical protein